MRIRNSNFCNLACMEENLSGETEYCWYLCLDDERIIE